MSPLDKAKLELVGAYAVNSLFWMYLNVKGENPKEHPVKQELDRIRSYMTRVKDIQDKELAPKLNKDASKRFVRNALWQQAQKQSHKTSDASNSDTSTAAESTSSSKQTDHKRKHKSETQGEKRRKGGSRYHYERTKQTYERKFTV